MMGHDFNDFAQGKTDEEVRAAVDGAEPFKPNGAGASHESNDRADRDHQSDGSDGSNGFSILSSDDFVRGFTSPDYGIDGITQRGFLYSLTGQTGGGKTALVLRLLASTALERAIGGHGVSKGKGLMLVGENPDDVRARWIALAEQMGFDTVDIDVHFVAGVYPISDIAALIEPWATELGGLSLIVVDTGAAYFPGEEENSNKEFGDYARTLRALTRMPGKPTVIVNCHPVKNAAADNLIPRGGGAFIAEVDGNLCCTKTDAVVELHWQGKFRGPDFAPVPFELQTVTSAKLVDTKGRPMPTVIARPLSEAEHANREDAASREMQKLLAVMAENDGASIASLADKVGWTGIGGVPQKSKVHRLLSLLKKQKLVVKELNVWTLTPSGEKAAKKGSK